MPAGRGVYSVPMETKHSVEMPGVEFLVNDRGQKRAVLIDLKKHGALWEDLYDAYLVHARRREPRESHIGREILEGLRELKRGEYGRVINNPDVASIRSKTGLLQAQFAALMGVSVRTLQDWEQGRRAPSGAARTLLLVASKNPSALLDVA